MTATEKKENASEDLDVLEEIGLAMAQTEIASALVDSNLRRTDVADRASRPLSFLSKILRGNHNLTVRTMARIVGACGYELRFAHVPISVTWVMEDGPIVHTNAAPPMGDALVGTTSVVNSGVSPIFNNMAA